MELHVYNLQTINPSSTLSSIKKQGESHRKRDRLGYRRFSLITNDELEKLGLNFSRC